ncbi:MULTISPECIES: class I SAM-dependent methyltransferase [unclassified Streptomyces]|uniref:class I SAM-dependent methyltransferase n=1 Tax=unclassified Streptomyces TaxID=2593676 RepID=UPI000CD56126|nr:MULTISPECIES: class I SAM-dependent methyltransferase [unclassified Streptomyces]
MALNAGSATAAGPLAAFREAGPGELAGAFGRLVGAHWTDGELNDPVMTGGAVPELLAAWDGADAEHRGYLAVALGLFVEAEYPALDGPVATAVRRDLERFLREVRATTSVTPLALALLYLLSHFPGERARVRSAFGGVPLGPDDRTRLDRGLTTLDHDDPDLGRAWPSPFDWDIDERERDVDRSWIRTLTPEQIAGTWEDDTRTLWATAGARALWAVAHGSPVPVADRNPYWSARHSPVRTADSAAFARHASTLRCTACRSGLSFEDRGARCQGCDTLYPVVPGDILDLIRHASHDTDTDTDTNTVGADEGSEADVLQKAAVMSALGHHYEVGLRPAFLRVMGQNWGGGVTPATEDAYIADRLREAAALDDGPVLDLAAGAGRWTWVVADAVGADRVIALDISDTMLHWLRGRLPQVAAVRASALELPLADGSLTAVNCWNALQAMPDAAQAIAEIGRCLRPGGTLTLMTFRWADDRVYRYFQRSHVFPGRPAGYLLFEPGEIRSWLANAGLSVAEESGPGTFVFITARKDG